MREKINTPKNADFNRGDTEGFDGYEEDAFLVLGDNLSLIAQNNPYSGNESTGVELYRIPLNKVKLTNEVWLVSFRSSNQASTSQVEEFKAFIQRFSTDKAFQLSRVKFPFKSVSNIGDDLSKNKFTHRSNWVYVDYAKPSRMSNGQLGVGNWTMADGDDKNENTNLMGACGCQECACGYFMSNHFQCIGGR